MELDLSINPTHWGFGLGVMTAKRRVFCLAHQNAFEQRGVIFYITVLCFTARLIFESSCPEA